MATRRNHDMRSSKSDTCDVLCNTFNKLRFKNASKHYFYEDYVLLRNQLLLLEYDEDDPSIPSKLFDVTELLRRYIEDVPKPVQETIEFVEDVHRKLRFLHECNCRHIKLNKRFPLSQELHMLLIRYVELEYEVLYCSHNYTPEYQKKVENRILSLLLIMMYDPTIKRGSENLVKSVTDTCAINALYIMRSVKAEYKKQHKLIENIMIKLLRKLNILDKVNEMRSKNKTLTLENLLQVPQVQRMYKYLQNRDYATDDFIPSEDEVEEVVEIQPVKDETKYNIEEKIKVSSFACYSVQRKVMTIDLADEDEDCYMVYFQPEVEKLDKKEKKIVLDDFNVQNSARTTSNISDRFDNYSQLNNFSTSSTCDKETFNSRCANSDASVLVIDDNNDSDIEIFCDNILPVVNLVDDSCTESTARSSTQQIPEEQCFQKGKISEQLQAAENTSHLEDVLLQCDDISDNEIENEDEILNRYSEGEENASQVLNTEPEIVVRHSETLPTSTTENEKENNGEYENTSVNFNNESPCEEEHVIDRTETKTISVINEINSDSSVEHTVNNCENSINKPIVLTVNVGKDTVTDGRIESEVSTDDASNTFMSETTEDATEETIATQQKSQHNEFTKQVECVSEPLHESVEHSTCNTETVNNKVIEETIAIQPERKHIEYTKQVKGVSEPLHESVEHTTCDTETVNNEVIEETIATQPEREHIEYTKQVEVVSEPLNESVEHTTCDTETVNNEVIEETIATQPEREHIQYTKQVEGVLEPLNESVEHSTCDTESVNKEVIEETIATQPEREHIEYTKQVEGVLEPLKESVEHTTCDTESVNNEVIEETIATQPEREHTEYTKQVKVVSEPLKESVEHSTCDTETVNNEVIEETIATQTEREHIEYTKQVEGVLEPLKESVEHSTCNTATVNNEVIEETIATQPERQYNEFTKQVEGVLEPLNESVEHTTCDTESVNNEVIEETIATQPERQHNEFTKQVEGVSEPLNECAEHTTCDTKFVNNEVVEETIATQPEREHKEFTKQMEDVSEPLNDCVEHTTCDNEVTEDSVISCNQPNDVEDKAAEVVTLAIQKCNDVISESTNLIDGTANCANEEFIEINSEELEHVIVTTSVAEEDCATREEQYDDLHIDTTSNSEAAVEEEDIQQSCSNDEDFMIEETVVTDAIEPLGIEEDSQINKEPQSSNEQIFNSSKQCQQEVMVSDILPSQDVPFNEEISISSEESHLAVVNDCNSSFTEEVVIATEDEQVECEAPNSDILSLNEEVEVPFVSSEPKELEMPSCSTPSNLENRVEIQDGQANAEDEIVTVSNKIEDKSESNSDIVDSTLEVTTSPNDGYTTQTSSEGSEQLALDVLASLAANRPKMEDAVQVDAKPSKKKGKKGRKAKKKGTSLEPLKIQENETTIVTRRITRSNTVKKQESIVQPKTALEMQEQCKCIPSTFMNLENLITPPPVYVYNFISNNETDNEESLDEPFGCIHNCENQPNLSHLNEILTRDPIFDEDTIEDGISLVNHVKQLPGVNEAVISIPDCEKDYPGINYDILKQAEEFEKTNLSLSSPEELCKELNLKKAKNDFPDFHEIYKQNLQGFLTDEHIETHATFLPQENSISNIEFENTFKILAESSSSVEQHSLDISKALDNEKEKCSPIVTHEKDISDQMIESTHLKENAPSNSTSESDPSKIAFNAVEEMIEVENRICEPKSVPLIEAETSSINVPPKKNKRRTWFGKASVQSVPVKKRKNYGRKTIINNYEKVDEALEESDSKTTILEAPSVKEADASDLSKNVETVESQFVSTETIHNQENTDSKLDTHNLTASKIEKKYLLENKDKENTEISKSDRCEAESIVHDDIHIVNKEGSELSVIDKETEQVASHKCQESADVEDVVQTDVEVEEPQINEPVEQVDNTIEDLPTKMYEEVIERDSQLLTSQENLAKSQPISAVSENNSIISLNNEDQNESNHFKTAELTIHEQEIVNTIDEGQAQVEEIKANETNEIMAFNEPVSSQSEISEVPCDPAICELETSGEQTICELETSSGQREPKTSDETGKLDSVDVNNVNKTVPIHLSTEYEDRRNSLEMPVLEKEQESHSLQEKNNFAEDSYPMLVAYEIETVAEEVYESCDNSAEQLEKPSEPQLLEEIPTVQPREQELLQSSNEADIPEAKTEDEESVNQIDTDKVNVANKIGEIETKIASNAIKKGNRPMLTKGARKAFQIPYVQLEKLPLDFNYKRMLHSVDRPSVMSQDDSYKQQKHETKHKREHEYPCTEIENDSTLSPSKKEKPMKKKEIELNTDKNSTTCVSEKEEKKPHTLNSKIKEGKLEDVSTKTRSSLQKQREKQVECSPPAKILRSFSDSKIESKREKDSDDKNTHKMDEELPLLSVEDDLKPTSIKKRRKSEPEKEKLKSDISTISEKNDKHTAKEEKRKGYHTQEHSNLAYKDKSRSSSRSNSKSDNTSKQKAEEKELDDSSRQPINNSDIKTDTKKINKNESKSESYSSRRHSTRSRSSSVNDKINQKDALQVTTDSKISSEVKISGDKILDPTHRSSRRSSRSASSISSQDIKCESSNLDEKSEHNKKDSSKVDVQLPTVNSVDKINQKDALQVATDSKVSSEVKISGDKILDPTHRSSRRSSRSASSVSSQDIKCESSNLDEKSENNKKDSSKVDVQLPTVNSVDKIQKSADNVVKQTIRADKPETTKRENDINQYSRERRESLRTRSTRDKLKLKSNTQPVEEKGDKSEQLLKSDDTVLNANKGLKEDVKSKINDKVRTRNNSRHNLENISKDVEVPSKQLVQEKEESTKDKSNAEEVKSKKDMQENKKNQSKSVLDEKVSECTYIAEPEPLIKALSKSDSDSKTKSLEKTKSRSRSKRSKSANKDPEPLKNLEENKSRSTERVKDKNGEKIRKSTEKRNHSLPVAANSAKELLKNNEENKPSEKTKSKKEERRSKSTSKAEALLKPEILQKEVSKELRNVDDFKSDSSSSKVKVKQRHRSEEKKNKTINRECSSRSDSVTDSDNCKESSRNCRKSTRTKSTEKTKITNDKNDVVAIEKRSQSEVLTTTESKASVKQLTNKSNSEVSEKLHQSEKRKLDADKELLKTDSSATQSKKITRSSKGEEAKTSEKIKGKSNPALNNDLKNKLVAKEGKSEITVETEDVEKKLKRKHSNEKSDIQQKEEKKHKLRSREHQLEVEPNFAIRTSNKKSSKSKTSESSKIPVEEKAQKDFEHSVTPTPACEVFQNLSEKSKKKSKTRTSKSQGEEVQNSKKKIKLEDLQQSAETKSAVLPTATESFNREPQAGCTENERSKNDKCQKEKSKSLKEEIKCTTVRVGDPGTLAIELNPEVSKSKSRRERSKTKADTEYKEKRKRQQSDSDISTTVASITTVLADESEQILKAKGNHLKPKNERKDLKDRQSTEEIALTESTNNKNLSERAPLKIVGKKLSVEEICPADPISTEFTKSLLEEKLPVNDLNDTILRTTGKSNDKINKQSTENKCKITEKSEAVVNKTIDEVVNNCEETIPLHQDKKENKETLNKDYVVESTEVVPKETAEDSCIQQSRDNKRKCLSKEKVLVSIAQTDSNQSHNKATDSTKTNFDVSEIKESDKHQSIEAEPVDTSIGEIVTTEVSLDKPSVNLQGVEENKKHLSTEREQVNIPLDDIVFTEDVPDSTETLNTKANLDSPETESDKLHSIVNKHVPADVDKIAAAEVSSDHTESLNTRVSLDAPAIEHNENESIENEPVDASIDKIATTEVSPAYIEDLKIKVSVDAKKAEEVEKYSSTEGEEVVASVDKMSTNEVSPDFAENLTTKVSVAGQKTEEVEQFSSTSEEGVPVDKISTTEVSRHSENLKTKVSVNNNQKLEEDEKYSSTESEEVAVPVDNTSTIEVLPGCTCEMPTNLDKSRTEESKLQSMEIAHVNASIDDIAINEGPPDYMQDLKTKASSDSKEMEENIKHQSIVSEDKNAAIGNSVPEVLPDLSVEKCKDKESQITFFEKKRRLSDHIPSVRAKRPRKCAVTHLIAKNYQPPVIDTNKSELKMSTGKSNDDSFAIYITNTKTSNIKVSETVVTNVLPKKNKRSAHKQKRKKKDLKNIDSIIENLKHRKSRSEASNVECIVNKNNELKLTENINMDIHSADSSSSNLPQSSSTEETRATKDNTETASEFNNDGKIIQEVIVEANEQLPSDSQVVAAEATNLDAHKTSDNVEAVADMNTLTDTVEQEVVDNSFTEESDILSHDVLVDPDVSELEVIESSLTENNMPAQEIEEMKDSHKQQSERTNALFAEQENYQLTLHENTPPKLQNSEEKDVSAILENNQEMDEELREKDLVPEPSVAANNLSGEITVDTSSLQETVPTLPKALTETDSNNHLLNDRVCEDIFPYTTETNNTIEDDCLLDNNVAFSETVEVSTLPNDILSFKEPTSATNSNQHNQTSVDELFQPKKHHSIPSSSTQMIHNLAITNSAAQINQIPISTAQLLGVTDKPQTEEVMVNLSTSTAEASTSCETTDNLIAVIFSNVCSDSEQSRSNKTGFIYFRGTDHNYHSIGDPLLGGECDTIESDRSSDTSKEIPTPELENVLVDDNILPYINALAENNQEPSSSLNESSVDSSSDFQLLEQCLIGNTLGRESSPPLPQTITCDNIYQANLKQEVLEYEENSASNSMEFPKENSEVYINQFQQQAMSVENMSELMNVVLTSIQNLNNMTRPTQNNESPRQENQFQPTKSDFNIDTDTVNKASSNVRSQNLESNCNFTQVLENNVYVQPETPSLSFVNDISETDFTNFYYLPVAYDNSLVGNNSSNKKVIVERIPQFPEQSTKSALEMNIGNAIISPSTSSAHNRMVLDVSAQSATTTKTSHVPPVKKAPPAETTTFQSNQLPIIKVKQSEPARSSNSLNLGFVRTSSRTRVSAPKPKKPSDHRKSVDDRDSENNATDGNSSGTETETSADHRLKLKVRKELNGVLENQCVRVVPARGRSLCIIEDPGEVDVKKPAVEPSGSTASVKTLNNKQEATKPIVTKPTKPKENVIMVEPSKQRTPKQTSPCNVVVQPQDVASPSELPKVNEKPQTIDLNAVKDLIQPKSSDYIEPVGQSDMIDNVKRRKRKPVDYSSIEKLLENDEFESVRMSQKNKHKKEESEDVSSRSKTKRKQDSVEEKQPKSKSKSKPANEVEKNKPPGSSDAEAEVQSNKSNSIFEDSDDDIPKKKKSKLEGRLEPEMMNALFDKLVEEGNINTIKTNNGNKSSREANASDIESVATHSQKIDTHSSAARTIPTTIFNLEVGLQKKPDAITPVKQIGVVNPIPRPSNNLRKEPPCNNRNSYSGGNEEGRNSSQYYPYYAERSRRSYAYSSRESSRSSHQGNSRRPEYPSHSNEARYSSQRSSSSSRSSRSSRHHSNSRSSAEQRSYRYASSTSDLAWREDMKKKFPHMFKDEVFF